MQNLENITVYITLKYRLDCITDFLDYNFKLIFLKAVKKTFFFALKKYSFSYIETYADDVELSMENNGVIRFLNFFFVFTS